MATSDRLLADARPESRVFLSRTSIPAMSDRGQFRPGSRSRSSAVVHERYGPPIHPAVGIGSPMVYTIIIAKDHGPARYIEMDVEPSA